MLEYLNETQMTSLEHINTITIYNLSKYMALDINARRNLEITEKMRDKSKKGTLLWVLDKTSTSMGGRLLRRWLNDPLLEVKDIQERLDAVKELKDNMMLRGEITDTLKKVYDIERLAGKMTYGNANARDMITLKNSLERLPEVKNVLAMCQSHKLKELYENLDELKDVFALIEKSIVEDPPMTIKDGGIIKLGYDSEIDTLKRASTEGKTWLAKLEADEKEKTGIKTLKVGYNKVFGYYIEGRHPVIEKMIGSGNFVPNDTYLDKNGDRLAIITGPNMAGKSTYMRQVALITLMAQVGSFVPATEAQIGVVDKIFTRVGASDDLSMGQSTFMVEMMEVATILKEATENSLVILDEIGRGTSTYDGLSIAWAVAEYIANKEKCGAKTLFATHYHELIELADKQEGIKNYSIAVKEKGEDIIFLRKIVEGGTDESYGIHVARLAGVPKVVTKRADEILTSLERKSMLSGKKQEKENKKVVEGQFDMFNFKLAEIAHEIDKINLNELTPIDALNTLMKIKEKMK